MGIKGIKYKQRVYRFTEIYEIRAETEEEARTLLADWKDQPLAGEARILVSSTVKELIRHGGREIKPIVRCFVCQKAIKPSNFGGCCKKGFFHSWPHCLKMGFLEHEL